MDFTSPSCFEAPPLFASQGEEIECSINTYRRTEKDARVAERLSLIEPVCKLNLQETSEFVKAFPPVAQNQKTSGVGRRRRDGERNVIVEAAEAPPTPGRPIFGFSNSTTTSTNKAMSSLIYSPSRNYFPSKWDDAQKWLIKNAHYHPPHALSSINNNFFKPPPQAAAEEENKVRVLQRSTSLNNHNLIRVSFTRGPGAPAPALILKDKLTNEIEQKSYGYSELPTKQGFVFGNSTKHETFCKEAVHHAAAEEEEEEVRHRDIGTEMTPLGSCTTSRCHTPFKSSSPMRHNTPSDRSGPLQVSLTGINGIPQFQDCHLAKLKLGTQFQDSAVTSNWSSREEEEEQISKSLRHYPMDKNVDCPNSDSDCRGFFNAWEENGEGKNNCCIRYQREEAKIQAWVNLQNAKVEAQSRKLEVKIEKMRSNLEEKLMKRMTIVNRKAEELRRTAQLQHCEQIERSREQPRKMMNRQNTNFSFGHNNSCACFLPCSK